MSLQNVSVGARGSPLSQAQIEEVLQEIRQYHPDCTFSHHYVKTEGDKDLKTSLKAVDKSDFFTKEIDEQLLRGNFRIAIHSAKDLPEHLKPGLIVAAITKGLDPEDVLVVRETLPANPIIATSSLRRELEIKRRFPTAKIVDIRGNIGQRLQILDSKKIDAVVMAKCALLRLNITDRICIALDGAVHPLQGKLAVVCRQCDDEMLSLFASIDHRPKMLYLGLDPPNMIDKKVVHCPLIETKAVDCNFPKLCDFTHILLTSKMAVKYFMQKVGSANTMQFISVGKSTTQILHSFGCYNVHTAENECQEGVIELISKLESPRIFWPHSNRSRDKLHSHVQHSVILYETYYKPPIQFDMSTIDEIFFSSPSTVDAFFHFFKIPDAEKKLSTQGNITHSQLMRYICKKSSHNCPTTLAI